MDKATKKVFKSVGLFVWYLMVPSALCYYVSGELLFNFFAVNVWCLFIVLAAICNAVMDSIESEYIVRTRFVGLNNKFWNKRISWQHAKMVFNYRLDAWHLFKSAMIILFALSVVFYKPVLNWWGDILVVGYLWNLTFNLFYNHIFRR